MALTRIDEKTLVQKIKFFIIGVEKPNWITRLSVTIGFAFWLYFVLYLSVIFLSILFVDTLENPELIKSTFGKIGGRYNFNIEYASHNWHAIDVIFYHSFISICVLSISLIGLIFIYRRKKTGYVLYLIGNMTVIIFTLVFMGLNYVEEQVSIIDKLLFVSITIYFLATMLFQKPNKKESTSEPEQQS